MNINSDFCLQVLSVHVITVLKHITTKLGIEIPNHVIVDLFMCTLCQGGPFSPMVLVKERCLIHWLASVKGLFLPMVLVSDSLAGLRKGLSLPMVLVLFWCLIHWLASVKGFLYQWF